MNKVMQERTNYFDPALHDIYHPTIHQQCNNHVINRIYDSVWNFPHCDHDRSNNPCSYKHFCKYRQMYVKRKEGI